MLLHACCANPHVLLLCRSIHTLATISTVFPFPLVFPFPTFSPTPHFSRGMCFFFWAGGGGVLVPHCSQNCLFRIFKPPFFPNPTHHFLELHGCVFLGGGGPCIRLFLVFPCPHFPFQPIFPNAPFSRGELPVCLWGVGYCTFIPIFL